MCVCVCLLSVVSFVVTDADGPVVRYRNGSCGKASVRTFSNLHVRVSLEILDRLVAVVSR